MVVEVEMQTFAPKRLLFAHTDHSHLVIKALVIDANSRTAICKWFVDAFICARTGMNAHTFIDQRPERGSKRGRSKTYFCRLRTALVNRFLHSRAMRNDNCTLICKKMDSVFRWTSCGPCMGQTTLQTN